MNLHEWKVNEWVKMMYQVPTDVFDVPKQTMVLEARLDLLRAKLRAKKNGHKDMGYLAAERFLEEENFCACGNLKMDEGIVCKECI